MTSISGTITGELEDPSSPLRIWLDTRLPNRKPIQKQFRESVLSECVEPAPNVRRGTIGIAFENLIGFTLSPDEYPQTAVAGAAWAATTSSGRPDWIRRGHAIAERTSSIAKDLGQNEGNQADDLEEFIRGCWSLALFTEIGRKIELHQSPLADVGEQESAPWFGCSDSLQTTELQDLISLYTAAKNTLLPYVKSQGTAIHTDVCVVGPLGGDIDMVGERCVVEIKTVAGRLRSGGTRRYGLEWETLLQILCYGLLVPTEHNIQDVALYNPRYDHLSCWRLDDVLTELAGKPSTAKDLAAELVPYLYDQYEPATKDSLVDPSHDRNYYPRGYDFTRDRDITVAGIATEKQCQCSDDAKGFDKPRYMGAVQIWRHDLCGAVVKIQTRCNDGCRAARSDRELPWEASAKCRDCGLPVCGACSRAVRRGMFASGWCTECRDKAFGGDWDMDWDDDELMFNHDQWNERIAAGSKKTRQTNNVRRSTRR